MGKQSCKEQQSLSNRADNFKIPLGPALLLSLPKRVQQLNRRLLQLPRQRALQRLQLNRLLQVNQHLSQLQQSLPNRAHNLQLPLGPALLLSLPKRVQQLNRRLLQLPRQRALQRLQLNRLLQVNHHLSQLQQSLPNRPHNLQLPLEPALLLSLPKRVQQLNRRLLQLPRQRALQRLQLNRLLQVNHHLSQPQQSLPILTHHPQRPPLFPFPPPFRKRVQQLNRRLLQLPRQRALQRLQLNRLLQVNQHLSQLQQSLPNRTANLQLPLTAALLLPPPTRVQQLNRRLLQLPQQRALQRPLNL